MTRWATRVLGGVVVVIAAVLVAPATSIAAETIGEDTTIASGSTSTCSGTPGQDCTVLTSQHPTRSFAAPFDGVVTRWRVRGNSFATQFALRILHEEGGTWTGAGTSSPATVLPGIENVFETRLPIQRGEFVGIDLPGGSGGPRIERRSATGAASVFWRPPLADQETRAPEPVAPAQTVFIYNADVEPDADADGFGDETQDQCVEAPGQTNGCPIERTLTLDANKGKVEKKKKVRLSGQLEATGNDSACEAGQTIEIVRTGLKGGTPVPVITDQTDAQGNFATKLKVKKSSLYTGRVAASANCEPETSDTEKVRVQKPKAAKEA